MGKYLFKRILIIIPTLIGATLLVFILSNLAPGGPLDTLKSSGNISEFEIQKLESELGLDKPVLVRYGIWLKDVATGNLGNSIKTNQPVSHLIGQRLAPTLILTLSAFVVALLIAIPLGIWSACKPYSFVDYFSSGIAFFATSIPNFFLSLIMIYIFSVKLGILPSSGMYNSGGPFTYPELIKHLILPMSIIVVQLVGSYIRYTRSSMLEVLNEDYIKTARSKGISEKRVIFVHAFRNSLISVVIAFGNSVPFIIGGATITEQIFAWPGIGSLMIQSITGRDYNTIMGITLIVASVVMIVNLIIDVIYSYLDPRIVYR